MRLEFGFQTSVHRKFDVIAEACEFPEGMVLMALFEFTHELVAFLRVSVRADMRVRLRGHENINPDINY